MNTDIQLAARRLHELIHAPQGVVGILAWQDFQQPKIRVFIAPSSRNLLASIPAEFDGFPVEISMAGDIVPFFDPRTKAEGISCDYRNYRRNRHSLRLSFRMVSCTKHVVVETSPTNS